MQECQNKIQSHSNATSDQVIIIILACWLNVARIANAVQCHSLLLKSFQKMVNIVQSYENVPSNALPDVF